MIIFTHIAPEYFINMIGAYALSKIETVDVYNLMSLDIRYHKIESLLPSVEFMSEESIQNDDSDLFEYEYFRYLDSGYAFNDLMLLLVKEFEQGATHLTIIEIERSPYRDSIVSSLMKYLYIRYGIKPVLFGDLEDWGDVSVNNSIFSEEGLMRMDTNMAYIYQALNSQNQGE